MSRPIVVMTPGEAELKESPLDPGTVQAGNPVTSEREIAAVPLTGGGTLATGIWRCTEGTVTDVEADETFVVLSGWATIEYEGRSNDVRPGDVCVLPAGAETRWIVHEAITKVYVVLDAQAAAS